MTMNLPEITPVRETAEAPLVSICCNTYNQKDFIAEALNGFLMQKTSFPFEIIVHDDASVDGTADIVREFEAKYPTIIKPIYQSENQFSRGNRPSLVYTWPKARGKYIALCEGDDFWTDQDKLQKQIDFMEAHPECAISGHNTSVEQPGRPSFLYNGEPSFINGPEHQIYTIRDVIPFLFIHTSSMVLRQSMMWPFPTWLTHVFAGDYFVALTVSQRGNIHFYNKVCSVYRINGNSISNYHSRLAILRDFEKHLALFDGETNHIYKSEIDLKLSDMRFSLYYYHPNYFKKLGFVFRNLGRIFRKDGFRQGYFSRLKLLIPSQLLRGWSNPLVAKKK